MSTTNNNATLKSIEQAVIAISKDLADIKNNITDTRDRVRKLESQFQNQFAPCVSEQQVEWLENNINQRTGKHISFVIFFFSVINFTQFFIYRN